MLVLLIYVPAIKTKKDEKDFLRREQDIENDCGQLQHAYLDTGDMLLSNKFQCDTGITEGLESSGNCEDSLSIKSNDTDPDSEIKSKFQHAYLDLGDFLSDNTPTSGPCCRYQQQEGV